MMWMRDFYRNLVELLDRYPTLALVTVVETEGSTPREHGAKMLVLPDGRTRGTIGGGGLERLVTEEALEAIRTGRGFFKEYDLVGKDEGGIGSKCGGRSRVMVEVITAPDMMLICGGGHIGHELAMMAGQVGFKVWVIDPREGYATKERYPETVNVMNASPASDEVRDLVTGNTYIVILTHDHVLDKEALRNLVGTDARYIGMIGSRRKVRMVMDELGKEGVDADALARVHAPIGLDIAAETPAEIAISILGEVIHIKRKGVTSQHSMKGAGT
jgi:xanthine dehydrogenase accessory factor